MTWLTFATHFFSLVGFLLARMRWFPVAAFATTNPFLLFQERPFDWCCWFHRCQGIIYQYCWFKIRRWQRFTESTLRFLFGCSVHNNQPFSSLFQGRKFVGRYCAASRSSRSGAHSFWRYFPFSWPVSLLDYFHLLFLGQTQFDRKRFFLPEHGGKTAKSRLLFMLEVGRHKLFVNLPFSSSRSNNQLLSINPACFGDQAVKSRP